MARRLKNLTITVEEETARWVRIEAAKQETSVSRLVGRILEERRSNGDEYQKAMRRALSRKPYLKSGARYPTREEIHERGRLR